MRRIGVSISRIAIAILLVALCSGTSDEASRAIDEETALPVEGAQLYLLTRGDCRRAPILLWLHGGPGGAERPLFRYFNSELERHFVVVYWDQRGAGRSFDPRAPRSALTVARHLADLARVVSHLKRELPQQPIALVGHSWGGALGLLYARDHPTEIAALIVVSPLIATRAANAAEYEFVVAEAERRGKPELVRRAQQIGAPPFASAAQALDVERLADELGAVYHRQAAKISIMLRGVLRGLVTPWEIARIIRGNRASLEAMHAELQSLDLRESIPALDVPVAFVLGRYDRHVDARIAAAYFARLRAPRKRLTWFEESAHNPPFEEPERFDATLERELRELGLAAEGSCP